MCHWLDHCFSLAEEPKTFTYDNVYDDDSRQKDVYDETAFPLVKSVMEGYNGQQREKEGHRDRIPTTHLMIDR